MTDKNLFLFAFTSFFSFPYLFLSLFLFLSSTSVMVCFLVTCKGPISGFVVGDMQNGR